MINGAIRVTQGKGGKARIVPCTWTTIRAIATDVHDSLWVLYPLNRPHLRAHPNTIYLALRRLGAALDITLHPHRLRHTYACECLRAGVNIYDLAQLLGHADIATTAIYLHVQPDELAERVRTAMERPPTPQLRLLVAA